MFQDQTAPDLGLHCLFRPVCPKISIFTVQIYYSISYFTSPLFNQIILFLLKINRFVFQDQTAPDQGLHCLFRPVCPKISIFTVQIYYSISYFTSPLFNQIILFLLKINRFVFQDQTAPDLGLHCLFRPVCPKISIFTVQIYYSISYFTSPLFNQIILFLLKINRFVFQDNLTSCFFTMFAIGDKCYDFLLESLCLLRNTWRRIRVSPAFYLGPVVQSIVSLTSSPRGQLVKCSRLYDQIH